MGREIRHTIVAFGLCMLVVFAAAIILAAAGCAQPDTYDPADPWPAEPFDDDDMTGELTTDASAAWGADDPGVEVADIELLATGCMADAGLVKYAWTSPALDSPPVLVDYGDGWFAPVVAVVDECPLSAPIAADVVLWGEMVYLWHYTCDEDGCTPDVASVRVMVEL